jgi:3alpha(or 20beta)-hydroxysteroid dehydrogenase
MRLEGKVALITGGAGGQGAAEVTRFLREGAQIMLTDIRDDEGVRFLAEVGSDAVAYAHLDVGSEADWSNVAGETEQRFGRLDVLVNNAGIQRWTPIESTTAEDFLALVRVNQLGVFLGIQAASRIMRRGGSIINVSSVAGLRGSRNTVAYTATKFAVRGMTKVAALELAPRRIRVNSIHPGYVATPMLEAATAGEASPHAARIPLGELSEPADIANLALFLASDESRHCTGAEFVVDGGITVGLGMGPHGRMTAVGDGEE